MLSERDGHRLDASQVGSALADLDEQRIAVWLGTVGDVPAASTAMYLRSLRHPDEDEPLPIGYWAHLFVLPEHRKLMLYPQLVFTMRRAMGELGIEAILTAMRRPNVTEGHLKLGFKVVCAWSVLIKPLKPFALLAKHKGLPVLAALAPVGDGLWRAGQSLRSGRPEGSLRVQRTPASNVRDDPKLLDSLAELMYRGSQDRIATRWTSELLRSRLGGGVDGKPYSVVLVHDEAALVGFAICRLAVRGNGIQTGVILDMVAHDEDERVLRALAQACEAQVRSEGAEGVLWLDGAGEVTSRVLQRRGFRVATSETYRLIAFTGEEATPLMTEDPAAWRFTFLDHDAF
ncbi:hypothetical protein AY599_11385 [Leptolyngbya valderiana BDU 20041]|nr:hypothetical protein AY599_11385 [Leptolyngbya valderiana BDU 20041]